MSSKIILFLLFFNFLYIYIYFHNTRSFPATRRTESDADHAKPWPTLPSYLPWSHHDTPAPLDSCEAYFGTGFSQRFDLLRPVAAGSGWFRCLYSETLQSSICEGGRVRMVPDRIRMSRGGERLEEVVGRDDDEELPQFEDGAFEVDAGGFGFSMEKKLVSEEFLDDYVPEGEVLMHTMRALLGSIQVVETKEFKCDEWIEEPTLLVTRFEYANLFHTFTDWYSSYVASRVTGLPNRPRLIFVDGHCATQLEETWKTLFSGVRYAKDFRGPVCFRHVILSPLGYETAFFKGLTEEVDCVGHDPRQTSDDHKTARLSEFGEMIRASFGLPVDTQKNHVSSLNILFATDSMFSV